MFKLVVLCTFLAAAVAKPGALIGAPLLYSSTVLAPATTTITKSASSVVHPSPLYYSAPIGYSHFIKKRSAPLAFATYAAPATYYSAAFAAPTYATLYRGPIRAAPVLYSAPHFIKKRSAPIAVASPYSYLAPTAYATAPYLSTYAATSFVQSTPFISTAPFAYSHFIKK